MNGQSAQPQPLEWSEPTPEHIPEPCYWPAVAALGISVTAMSLAMIWVVFVVGLAITAVGFIGWIGALTDHD